MLPLLTATAFAATVAVVPGCPTDLDGTLSDCQWRRTLWAASLYEAGEIDHIVVSGADAYTPWRESTAMAAALRRLGVPAERVHEEPEALHTDENVAFSLRIAERLDARRIVVATDALQAGGACGMVRAWSGLECTARRIDYRALSDRMRAGAPEWRVEGTEGWVPLEERERRMAAERGEAPRPSSFRVYVGGALTGKPPPAR